MTEVILRGQNTMILANEFIKANVAINKTSKFKEFMIVDEKGFEDKFGNRAILKDGALIDD